MIPRPNYQVSATYEELTEYAKFTHEQATFLLTLPLLLNADLSVSDWKGATYAFISFNSDDKMKATRPLIEEEGIHAYNSSLTDSLRLFSTEENIKSHRINN